MDYSSPKIEIFDASIVEDENFDSAPAGFLQELYEPDMRRVVVMEGTRALNGGRGCVEEANELIQGYNARLAARLDDLRPELPGAAVVFCDVYRGMMEILSNPGRYGKDEMFQLSAILFN